MLAVACMHVPLRLSSKLLTIAAANELALLSCSCQLFTAQRCTTICCVCMCKNSAEHNPSVYLRCLITSPCREHAESLTEVPHQAIAATYNHHIGKPDDCNTQLGSCIYEQSTQKNQLAMPVLTVALKKQTLQLQQLTTATCARKHVHTC
jgi:hypothetical protein